MVVHDKSSLAPEGASILFSLRSDTEFSWSGFCDTTASELLTGSGPSTTKTEQAERLLLELLKDGEVASEELLRQSSALGISERTLKIAKQNQGVVSVRRGDRWYAKLRDGGAASHGGGVVRAGRRFDGDGRNHGGADTSAGEDICKAQSLGDQGAGNGVDSGVEGDPPPAGTGWEEERAALFSAVDPSAPAHAGVAADPGGAAGIAGAVVRLGHALERSEDAVPIKDATATHRHSDSKALRRERQKKIALGHKEDDHEEEPTWQQTM